MNAHGVTRRGFMKSLGLGSVAMTMPRVLCADGTVSRKPNIIFVMTDDLGYGDLGCYGQKKIKTPNLDRMAAEGMRFTQCYAGSPVCAPSRCILMTGLHSGHCRRRDNRTKAHRDDMEARNGLLPLAKDDFTVAAMLKVAGYVVGGFGKWGLGNPGTTGTPGKHGFDTFYGYLDQVHAHDYYTSHLYRNTTREELPGNKDGKRQQYSHDLIAAEMLKFIRDNRDRPFFCYVPWTIPHAKHVVPDQGQYKNEPWDNTEKNYAAMITRMDSDLGKLFALLKELGIDDNTIVLFTSDNGPSPLFLRTFNSNGSRRGIKRQLYEGGIRVPMIVRWPGRVPAGTVHDLAWSFADFMPTAAALADIKAPERLDGMSVLPTLLGRKQQPREYLYWEFYSPFQQAVRMGNWKGIRFGTREPLELYNLADDPKETHNIADKHLDIISKIESAMVASHSNSRYWPVRLYRK